HGVSIYTMKDVRERPIQEILQESIDELKKKVDHIYISVDMDVLDQAYAPGCPFIGPGGMHSDTLIDAMTYLGQEKHIVGIDFVEVDPTIDVRDMTTRLVAYLALTFLKGRKMAGLPVSS